jgi:hypothetical protein
MYIEMQGGVHQSSAGSAVGLAEIIDGFLPSLIGSAELFTGGEESEANLTPQPPVNNSGPRRMFNEAIDNKIISIHNMNRKTAHPGRRIVVPNGRRLPTDFRPRVTAPQPKRMLRSFRSQPVLGCLTNYYKVFEARSQAVFPLR